MKVSANLKLDKNLRFIGSNERGMETYFDTFAESGGDESAATPMEILLQAVAACSSMDVVSIIKKKRKEVAGLNIDISATKSDENPKVYTDIHLHYKLDSKDAEMNDLERAIELSQTKYCSVSIMLKNGGVKITSSAEIFR